MSNIYNLINFVKQCFKNVNLYWHTLRHLRPIQFYWRLWLYFYIGRVDYSPAPSMSKESGNWSSPARRDPSLKNRHSWFFLNKAGCLKEIGWSGSQRSKLWRYNQHYFDDLNSRDFKNRKNWHSELIEEWIDNNPPGKGEGWEPYPTSLRIVNWIKWSMGGETLSKKALHSLSIQIRWLNCHIEYHLQGNHLFSNAKALTFAGLFFEGKEAGTWLKKGLTILIQQEKEQLLSDGGHFELSPMYQALFLEDFLDLINVMQAFRDRITLIDNFNLDHFKECSINQLYWLKAMCHPDGEISFFNDSAFGIAPSLAELETYASRVLGRCFANSKLEFIHLEKSGYIRLEYGLATAIIDIAPLGPIYQPAHAHADTLSFELSIGSTRVFVNSGTSLYCKSIERLRQRSTKAHNTVVVNELNSSEVWSSFRVAQRATPTCLEVKTWPKLKEAKVSCSHNGYRRVLRNTLHKRTWLMNSNSLTVNDLVTGKFKIAEARFHFHPDIVINSGSDQSQGKALINNKLVLNWEIVAGKTRLEPTTWHPRFGVSIKTSCLVVKLLSGNSSINFSWVSH